jgi:hypothetical protein
MKQRKFPHQLFAPALAPPDISLGLPFNPAMTISSTRKSIWQSGIYTDAPSNANTPLTVKALSKRGIIMASEDRFSSGQATNGKDEHGLLD